MTKDHLRHSNRNANFPNLLLKTVTDRKATAHLLCQPSVSCVRRNPDWITTNPEEVIAEDSKGALSKARLGALRSNSAETTGYTL